MMDIRQEKRCLYMDLHVEHKTRKHLQPTYFPLIPGQPWLYGEIKSLENLGTVATFGSLSDTECHAIMITMRLGMLMAEH